MKKLLFITAILLTINQLAEAQTHSINRFVRQYKHHAMGEKVDITIPGWLVRLGSRFIDKDDTEGVDIHALARKVRKVRVVSIEDGAKIAESNFQNLINDAKSENFEELLTVRSDGDNVNILIKEEKDIIRDLFIMVKESDGEFVLVNVTGKFTMQDINRIIEKSQKKREKVDSEAATK